MKYVLKILISLLLITCTNSSLIKSTRYDEKLMPHIIKFEQYLGSGIPNNLTIRIDYIHDSNNNKVFIIGGYCNTRKKIIVINKLRWGDWEPWMREMVLFHELGHCVLNHNHPDHEKGYIIPAKFKKENCPPSIMVSGTRPPIVTKKCYNVFYDDYMKDLFGPSFSNIKNSFK